MRSLPRHFKSYAVSAALAAVLVLLVAPRASAMPMAAIASRTDVQAYNSTPTLLGDATDAKGAFSGNDVMGPSNDPLASQLTGGLFGYINWNFLGKSDDTGFGPFTSNPGGTSGTLVLDNPLNGPLALSLKAGNFYSVYFFDETFFDVKSFEFTTAGVAKNVIGKPLALSHASLFHDPSFTTPQSEPSPSPNVVPEPTSIAIWSLIGLGCAGYATRRRRKKVAA